MYGCIAYLTPPNQDKINHKCFLAKALIMRPLNTTGIVEAHFQLSKSTPTSLVGSIGSIPC